MTATAHPWYVTGEPGAFDREDMEIYLAWGRALDPDPLLRLLERWSFRTRPCMFAQIQITPTDMQHLQRVGWERRGSVGLLSVAQSPLFALPVLVDPKLEPGLVRLERCRTADAHEGCRFDQPVWLDTKAAGKIHGEYGCALSALGVTTRDHTQCLDGTQYDHCSARECEGYCVSVGICGCVCHGS